MLFFAVAPQPWAGGPCFQFRNISFRWVGGLRLHFRAGLTDCTLGRTAHCTTLNTEGCTKGRASGLHIKVSRRAALKGRPAGCRKVRASGLEKKGGPFNTRVDCVKNYYFSQLHTFITLYKMADRSMQERTAQNIIEIASFRCSTCWATWLAVRYNITRKKTTLYC